MAVPTKPYSTPTQVAYLIQNRFYAGAPSATTVPTDTVVEQLISWVDGMVEMAFHGTGYKIPWIEVSGETWPAAQTALLTYMSAIGAAAMAGGHILKPAPMMGPGREGSGGNVYSIAVEKMLAQVREDGFRFRAQYYEGSKAEKWIAPVYGPRMDFLEDYWDPTRYWLTQQYTQEIETVFSEMSELDVDWDFMYRMRSSN